MNIIPEEVIDKKIFIIRGHKVMFDADLAELYQVSTGNLNLAVKRNIHRFPSDFMFQLTKDEFANLILQFAISRWGGRRKLPYAFTEHGVSMLSSVLKSERAIVMNIYIIRAFIKLRELLATNKDIAQKIGDLERIQKEQGDRLSTVCSVVQQLITEPKKTKGKIGFSPT